jgi:EmrB/QacA subfamily drug resistance transporter
VPQAQSKSWLLLCIVSLGVSTGPLDTAVNIAFPAITAAFGIAVTTIQWVVICYVLTYASLLLGCGRLGDVVGHKRVFLFGLGWCAVSLYLCGLAPTFGWFLFFRGLQGVGTALVFSCAPALVTLAFPEAQRSQVLGVYTMFSAVASALGPLVGGQLVALWGWSAVYYFRVPVVLLSAILTVLLVRQPATIAPGQRFDGLGAATLTAAIAGLLLMLNQGNHFGWLSLPTLLLCGGACGCLGFFMWHQGRCAEPVLDLSLFRHGAFAIANAAHVLVNVAGFTVMLLVPYYLLTYYHASAVAGGVLLSMSPLGTMLASPIGGRLLSSLSAPRLSLAGITLVSAGLLGVGLWQVSSVTALVAGTLLVQGLGQGLFQVANMDYVMGSIPRHQQGVAGSLTMLTRTVGVVGGATLGSGIFGLLQPHYTAQLQAASTPVADLGAQAFMLAFQGVFWCAAAVAAVAGVLMWSSRFTAAPP